jgi:hypothetical protein
MPLMSQVKCAEGVIEASKSGGEADSVLCDKRLWLLNVAHGQDNVVVQWTSEYKQLHLYASELGGRRLRGCSGKAENSPEGCI